MSDYETHKGTLKPTELSKEEVVGDFLRNYKGTNRYTLRYKEDLEKGTLTEEDINEFFQEIEEYTELNDIIYVVMDRVQDGDAEFYELTKKENGELEYFVRFYNGGCSFNEALDMAHKT